MSQQIQLRGGTAALWTSVNPVLADREIGVETDTKKFKIGDGATVWTSLGYASGTAPDATTSVKGLVELAGDLAGTAAAPVVARVNGVAVTGTPTTGQVVTATGSAAATWQTPTTGGVPTSRAVTAGTGLTGGGDLTADRTLAVAYGTTSGTAAQGDDSRIVGALQSGATAGGDLSGPLASPTVAKVNGVTVTGTPASSGLVLTATSTTAAAWQAPAAGASTNVDGGFPSTTYGGTTAINGGTP